MYFTKPSQLLDLFTALEESNLFLIQNSQETEAALEELKTKFADTKARMDKDSKALEAQIEALRGQIKVEEEKGAHLHERAGKHQGVQAQEGPSPSSTRRWLRCIAPSSAGPTRH